MAKGFIAILEGSASEFAFPLLLFYLFLLIWKALYLVLPPIAKMYISVSLSVVL